MPGRESCANRSVAVGFEKDSGERRGVSPPVKSPRVHRWAYAPPLAKLQCVEGGSSPALRAPTHRYTRGAIADAVGRRSKTRLTHPSMRAPGASRGVRSFSAFCRCRSQPSIRASGCDTVAPMGSESTPRAAPSTNESPWPAAPGGFELALGGIGVTAMPPSVRTVLPARGSGLTPPGPSGAPGRGPTGSPPPRPPRCHSFPFFAGLLGTASTGRRVGRGGGPLRSAPPAGTYSRP